MPPFFKFMTGAGLYRIEARSKEEAIRIAVTELNPNDDTRSLIVQTMYDEEECRNYVSESTGSD